MSKIKSFITSKPLVAVLIAAAIGGVLALAFPAVAKWLKPVAQKVPGNQA